MDKKMAKNRWMVGRIEKIYEKKMDGWMDKKIKKIDRWMDRKKWLVGWMDKKYMDGWKDKKNEKMDGDGKNGWWEG